MPCSAQRALAEYLGHADRGFTPRTYTNLRAAVPGQGEAGRQRRFERLANGADDPRGGPDVVPEAL